MTVSKCHNSHRQSERSPNEGHGGSGAAASRHPSRGKRPIELVAIVALAVLELAGVLSLALGPAPFERTAAIVASRLEFAYLKATLITAPTPAGDDDLAAESVLVKVVDLARSGQTEQAASSFSPNLLATSHFGRLTFERAIGPAELPDMVALGYAPLSVVRIRLDRSGADSVVEVAQVQAWQLRAYDIGPVDAIFQVTVSEGKITRVSTTFDPAMEDWLVSTSPQLRVQPGTPVIGLLLALAAIALPIAVCLRLLPVKHRCRLALILVLAPWIVAIVVEATTESRKADDPLTGGLLWLVPERVVYASHAALGDVTNRLDRSPRYAAVQWVKAASHAESSGQVLRAAEGIAAARARSRDIPELDAELCAIFGHGSPPVRDAIEQAGVGCW